MKMDKCDLVLDLIEHPENYTQERIGEILSDTEARELYNLLCKTNSALVSATGGKVAADAEWRAFNSRYRRTEFRVPHIGNRAASIVIVAMTSLAAVAIGITVAVKNFEPKQQTIEVAKETSAESQRTKVQKQSNDTIKDMGIVDGPDVPELFVNASLEDVLGRIAETHQVTVEYVKPETAQLHLYYRFDPALTLDETIEQLNTFEQINIRISDNKIIVD